MMNLNPYHVRFLEGLILLLAKAVSAPTIRAHTSNYEMDGATGREQVDVEMY